MRTFHIPANQNGIPWRGRRMLLWGAVTAVEPSSSLRLRGALGAALQEHKANPAETHRALWDTQLRFQQESVNSGFPFFNLESWKFPLDLKTQIPQAFLSRAVLPVRDGMPAGSTELCVLLGGAARCCLNCAQPGLLLNGSLASDK